MSRLQGKTRDRHRRRQRHRRALFAGAGRAGRARDDRRHRGRIGACRGYLRTARQGRGCQRTLRRRRRGFGEALVAKTVERFGRIDILVNNAALYAKLSPRNFDEWDAELWDRVMAINVRGPYLMVRHVAPHMIARKSGKIINIASGAAYKGVPRMLPYVTSKGAMLAFTRALSRELGQHNIAVNSLSPGYILERHGPRERDPCRGGAGAGAQQPCLQTRRLSGRSRSARWCFWPRRTAISSPASRWWWTAVRSIISSTRMAGWQIRHFRPARDQV